MTAFRVIDGCPCNPLIAPYFALLLHEVGAHANSIYRGQDAAAILHHHGHHTQAELYATMPAGTCNPPGRSTHELRSDGVAYPGPVGRQLSWWQQGIDVDDYYVPAMKYAAHRHGWWLHQPYTSGVEFHHLNFVYCPHPASHRSAAKLQWLRATLPRR